MTPSSLVAGVLRRQSAPASVAALVGAVGLLAAAVVPDALDLDPFTSRAAALPVAFLVISWFALGACWLVRRSDLVVGAAAGVVATTVALGLQQILHGSPYAPGGLVGDIGRYTALATRYTVTTGSADGVIPGAPSEYPPLVPWLVGKTAVLLDRPAWTLVAGALTILTALSVVAAFWLWNRVASAPVALLLASVPMLLFSAPDKAFHLVALAVLAPWVYVTFAGLSRADGGLHWSWAGLLGALQVMIYPGYLVFAAVGIAAIVIRTWWTSGQRAHYVRHLLGVAAVAFVLLSWYVLPFLLLRRSFSTGSVSDTFDSLANYSDPAHLPPQVLATHPILLGMWLLGALSLAWWASRGRTWAWVVGSLVVGAYLYRTVRLVVFIGSGSTGFLQYASRLVDILLCSAAVLGVAEALPVLARRLRTSVPAAVTLVLVGLTAAMAPLAYLSANRLPVSTIPGSRTSLQAQIEPLPDCSLPRYSPRPLPPTVHPATSSTFPASLAFVPVDCFPAAAVRDAVDGQLGTDALPVAISYSERLWAFYPWYAFITNDRTAAGLFQNYDARLPLLQRLTTIDDPARLAAAMATTSFGPIDVMVLHTSAAGLSWSAGGRFPAAATFRRSQFARPAFTVVDVGHSTVVVIRSGADVPHVPYPR